jgi:GDPmannose 4,6-dehydratase
MCWGYAAKLATIIATNETHSVREFLEVAFGHVGLNYHKHVETDPRYHRPAEVELLIGDYSKAKRHLGWETKTRRRFGNVNGRC